MNTVDRHYRLPKAVYEKIDGRDRNRFPAEKDYITEAVMSYEREKETEELARQVRDLGARMDRVMKAMGW